MIKKSKRDTSIIEINNKELVRKYVLLQHVYTQIGYFKRYLENGFRIPDYISLSGIFYEIEEYDLDGKFLTYANATYRKGITIEWDELFNRYSRVPHIDRVWCHDMHDTRNDMVYKSAIDNNKWIPLKEYAKGIRISVNKMKKLVASGEYKTREVAGDIPGSKSLVEIFIDEAAWNQTLDQLGMTKNKGDTGER